MEEKKINLNLTVNEVNMLLEALSNMPYKTVYQLINSIQTQGITQINEKKEDKE